MTVEKENSEYIERVDDWKKCRDFFRGKSFVLRKGEEYLPKLSTQSASDYLAYLNRAHFFGAMSRTVEAFSGMVMRKPPVVDVDSKIEEWATDVTGEGDDLPTFIASMVDEQLITGRLGVLLDMPKSELDSQGVPVQLSRAQAEAKNIKPFTRVYPTETIINWRTGRLSSGKTGLVFVCLKESYDLQDPSDEFSYETKTQYRVLDIDESGNYRQRVFRLESKGGNKDNKQTEFEKFNPIVNGNHLKEIPFIFVTSNGTGAKIRKPPLLDMVDANHDHFKIGADYYHGLHYVGLPTPVISGIDPEGESVPSAIGPTEIWVLASPDAKAEYLQVDSEGFTVLRSELQRLEGSMAALGARILSPDEKSGVESGVAKTIRSNAENATLTNVALSAGEAAEKLLRIAGVWLGLEEPEVSVKMNVDFVSSTMDPAMLRELVAALMAGGISQETFFYNIKKGELTPDDRTMEEEADSIGEEAGGLTGMIGREASTAGQ